MNAKECVENGKWLLCVALVFPPLFGFVHLCFWAAGLLGLDPEGFTAVITLSLIPLSGIALYVIGKIRGKMEKHDESEGAE